MDDHTSCVCIDCCMELLAIHNHSQPGPRRIGFDGLANCQICHNLFTATIHRRDFVHTMKCFDYSSHCSLGDATATQHLHSTISNQMCHPSSVILEKRNACTNFSRLRSH